MRARTLIAVLSVGALAWLLVSGLCPVTNHGTDSHPPTPEPTPRLEHTPNVSTSPLHLFDAASFGLPLGVLSAKYAADLPEDPGDPAQRKMYTSLLEKSATGLGVQLSSAPTSLLPRGRGAERYHAVASWFGQLRDGTARQSRCVKYTAGLSLNSALLVYGFHGVTHAADETKFKVEYVTRLDQFGALATTAAMACKEEGFDAFAKELESVGRESLAWLNRAHAANRGSLSQVVLQIGKTHADRLNTLAEKAAEDDLRQGRVRGSVDLSPTPSPSPAAAAAKNIVAGESALVASRMFAALNCRYWWGYLVTTYIPMARESPNTDMARKNYSMLLVGGADMLGFALSPDPKTLVRAGRGLDQTRTVDSYYDQISANAKGRSRCLGGLMGMSLIAGRVIRDIYSYAPAAGYLRDEAKFKEVFQTDLSALGALAQTAALFCGEEKGSASPTFLSGLKDMGETSWTLYRRIRSTPGPVGRDTVDEAKSSVERWMESPNEMQRADDKR